MTLLSAAFVPPSAIFKESFLRFIEQKFSRNSLNRNLVGDSLGDWHQTGSYV